MTEERIENMYKTKLEIWLCKKCVIEFETEKLLDEHILSVHKKIPDEKEGTGVAEPGASNSRSQHIFTCEQCCRAFNSSFLYYKHVATEHGNEVNKPDETVEAARTTPKPKRTITCKVCNKNFSSNYLYYKHVFKAHHIEQDGKREQNKKIKNSAANQLPKDQPKEAKPPKKQNKKINKSAANQLPKDQPKEDKPPKQTPPRPPTKFTCKICSSNFSMAYFYYKHLNISHEIAKSTAKVADTSTPRRTPASKQGPEKLTCKICQCILNTNYQYYKHLATAHLNIE